MLPAARGFSAAFRAVGDNGGEVISPAPMAILLAAVAFTAAAPERRAPETPGEAAISLQDRSRTPYEARLDRYRSGDFVGAIRDALDAPWRDLEAGAEEFRRRARGTPEERDLSWLAAAMLHLDLAGPAEARPRDQEEMAERFLAQVGDGARRTGWLLDARLGLLGFYASRSRWEDAVRVAGVLAEQSGGERSIRRARAWLAEALGWGFHDERFLDQAQFGYSALLEEAAAGEVASLPDTELVDLRLRLAHLTLREGSPEATLALLDAGDGYPDAISRFAAAILRGETHLWLENATAAEQAFAEAHAIHSGSVSAAAGLSASRQRLGDAAGAAEAARRFLQDTAGDDAWQRFLLGGLTREGERLDRLRALVLVRTP